MKKPNFIGLLMMVASSMLFIQCTSDPIAGPPGVDGKDGVDGIDGIDGSDAATASCVACHSNSFRDPIRDAYAMSFHATSGLERFGNRGDDPDDPDPLAQRCSRCHTNEGFIDYAQGGLLAVSSVGYSGATAITCATCHNVHRSFDFENDGNDFALRKIDPVTLETFPDYTIDLGGHSNLCVNCHQPRDLSPPTDNGLGLDSITNTRFGPHHSPQSTIFEGIQLVLVAGSEAIPGVGTSEHRQQASCVICHMGETTDGTDGSHTFIPTLNACIQCHPGTTSFDRNDVQTEVTALLDELEGLLFTEGVVDADGSSIIGLYPIKTVNAYWNWKSVSEDGSKGIHNPDYIRAILKNSIESMQN
jgi:hypothetical protein